MTNIANYTRPFPNHSTFYRNTSSDCDTSQINPKKNRPFLCECLIAVPLKGWNSSSIWEQRQQIKITFRKKLRAGRSQGMLAITRCRILCLPVFYSKKSSKIKIYRTIILPVVLYGCETWSLTLRKERRLRVFENRVLRRIFGFKRDEVRG